MNQQAPSFQLTGAAARIALPFAAILWVGLVVIGFIPCCGFLVFPAGSTGLGYLATQRLNVFATPESKVNYALYIGLGAGALAAVALVLSTITWGLIGTALSGVLAVFADDRIGALTSTGVGAVGTLFQGVFSIFAGALFGILFAALGSYLYLNRNPGSQGYSRPF